MGFINNLTKNYVFSVELLMILGVILFTLYVFYKLGIFRQSK